MSQPTLTVVVVNAQNKPWPRPLFAAMTAFAALAMSGASFAQCLYRPPAVLPNPGIKLIIRADQPVFEIGKPVIIHVELVNESKGPLNLIEWWFPERNYELHVKDSGGKESVLTKWGREIRTDPIHGSTNRETLVPGEKHEDKEDLTRLYEITVPGEYTVEACRVIDGWGNLYSEKIKIGFVQ